MQALLATAAALGAAPAAAPAAAAAAAAAMQLPAALAAALAARPPPLRAAAAAAAMHRLFTSSSSTSADASSSNTSSSSSNAASAAGGGAGGELHVTVEPLSGACEGASVITLVRPAARNAIGRQLLRELAEALDTVRQERTTRCVLLRSGVPGVFCAGADLKERATMSQGEAAEFVSRIRRTFTELQDLPMPTIAVMEGAALGGGAELALAADLRLMALRGGAVAFPEAQLGIIPGAGGTQRLPRLVGASRAKELIFTGRRVGAEEAAAMGLVDYAVPDEEVYSRALALAEQIVKSAPLSLRQAKAAVNRGLDVDLHTGLALEGALYAQLLPTRDRLEGLAAFKEKREPRYTGE